MADEDNKSATPKEAPADMAPATNQPDNTVNDPAKQAATGTVIDMNANPNADTVINAEQPNAALTTVDDETVAQAGRERTDPANPDIPTTSEQTPVEMPSKVLENALQPAPVVQSQDQADPNAAPLVVAPTLGQALEVARDNAVDGPASISNPANPVQDIGAGAADASGSDVVVSAPAKPKATGDGLNSGATDATGYVAPIRVSAAGVPASDPTVAAANIGDVNTVGSGPSAYTQNSAPGTSDKPNPGLPSTGADATAESVASRINGNAQSANPGNLDPSPDVKAQVDGRVAAMTGTPLPPSGGDSTMTNPVPVGGSTEAAEAVAAFHTQDAPAASDAPAPSEAGRADPNAVATAVEAANSSDNPPMAHPDTARPIGEPLNAPSPAAEAVTPKVTSVPARDGSNVDTSVPPTGEQTDAEKAANPPPSTPYPGDTPSNQSADAAANDEDDLPMATTEQKINAAEVLHQEGVLPGPVLADIKASLDGPQSESDVKNADESEGDLHYIDHHVMSKTTFVVRAKDTQAAIDAVKAGKGASTSVHADEEWEGR